MGKIEMGDMVGDSRLEESLPLRQAGVLSAWRQGDDLRSRCTKTTFYRYRREILEAVGVDIAQVPPVDAALPVATVRLREVLEAVEAGVPAWAEECNAIWRRAA